MLGCEAERILYVHSDGFHREKRRSFFWQDHGLFLSASSAAVCSLGGALVEGEPGTENEQ